ncbi:NosD domain-containing protein [Bryobacter aggregatus]|uniref:NosD domain-containing protein n=1 Tax=Bryobacter aggregatus TaxID=360054 RepID=UPI0004E20824|nr:NosD domain-containing protein [Bryobacter aggregatus]
MTTRILKFLGLCCGASLSLFAQNTTTWVSATGNDSNNCTQSSPCLTMQAAYNKTNESGSIHALSAGNFGSLSIAKSIRLQGVPGAILQQLTVTVTSATVAIEDITIETPPSNAAAFTATLTSSLLGVSTISLRNVSINTRNSGVTARFQIDTGSNVYLKDITVSGGTVALAVEGVSGGGNTYLDHVSAFGATKGLYLESVTAMIRNSNFHHNTLGIQVSSFASSSSVLLKNTDVSSNGQGLVVSFLNVRPTNIRLDGSSFTENGTGISPADASIYTFRTNIFAGNVVDGAPALAASLR